MPKAEGRASEREPTIILELRGRLGNQLFEFAAAYAQTLRLGCRLLISSRRLKRIEPNELPRLIGPAYQEATTGELLRAGRIAYNVPGRVFLNSTLRSGLRVVGELVGHPFSVEQYEDFQVFDSRVLEARPPCVLRGVFASERYFADRAEDIDAAIHLPDVDRLLPDDVERPLVGVSFRRGDFNSLGWNLPLAYYEAALTQLRERVTPGTLVVFSDDPEFNELAQPWLARFGRVLDGLTFSVDPVDNLAVLAACDHSIVANSTFSWWGAWLADRRSPTSSERLVYAPGDWRRIAPTDDSIPDRWHRVDWDSS